MLAYSLVGSALSFGLYVVAPSVPSLFISHTLHGLTQCTFLICMSAVTDATHNPDDPSSLTHAFGLIGVALGSAFVLGPIVGGVLGDILGFKAIYAISSALFMLTLWALNSFMVETLDVANRKPFNWSEAVPLRSARMVMSRSRGLSILAMAYFLCSLTVGVFTLWILYTRVRYGFGPGMAGLMMSLNGAIVVTGQGCVIRYLIPALASEGTVAVVSYLSHAVLFFLVGGARTGLQMILAICLAGVPSSLGEPAIKSVMAHLVPSDVQGSLQGVMGSVYVLAQVISPIVYSTIFRFSIDADMRAMYPTPCPEGYEPPPELEHHDGTCGGLPGIVFDIQGCVFVVASLLMRYGLAVVAREGTHAAELSNDASGERAPLTRGDGDVEMSVPAEMKLAGEF